MKHLIALKKKTKIRRINLDQSKRLIFVSDIHGDVDTFKKGLDSINFSNDDYLFIIGDMVEKGDKGKNLETLRYFIKLSKNDNVFPMAGNCDEVFRFILNPEAKDQFLYYTLIKKHSVLNDIADELGYELSADMNVREFVDIIRDKYSEFYDFMESLDDVIFINDSIVLVHGGIDDINNISETSLPLLKYDNFYEKSKTQNKIMIVGHNPTRNYRADVSSVNPIFDFKKNIISIDGGNHIVKGGQINFVILESLSSMKFSYKWVDHYEKYIMNVDVDYDDPSNLVSITYNNNEVEIIDIDLDFYLIRHIKTNSYMWVHTSFVYKNNVTGSFYTYDASNQFLSVRKNDEISIIKRAKPYSIIKKNGYIGLIDTKYISDDF